MKMAIGMACPTCGGDRAVSAIHWIERWYRCGPRALESREKFRVDRSHGLPHDAEAMEDDWKAGKK